MVKLHIFMNAFNLKIELKRGPRLTVQGGKQGQKSFSHNVLSKTRNKYLLF